VRCRSSIRRRWLDPRRRVLDPAAEGLIRSVARSATEGPRSGDGGLDPAAGPPRFGGGRQIRDGFAVGAQGRNSSSTLASSATSRSGRRCCSDRSAEEVSAAGSRPPPPPPRELAAAPQWACRTSGRSRELISLSIRDGDEGDCWSATFF
jgi:hypothetical protein